MSQYQIDSKEPYTYLVVAYDNRLNHFTITASGPDGMESPTLFLNRGGANTIDELKEALAEYGKLLPEVENELFLDIKNQRPNTNQIHDFRKGSEKGQHIAQQMREMEPSLGHDEPPSRDDDEHEYEHSR